MVNDQLVKDMTKALVNSDLGGSRELEPGATPRRYEPNGGINKHNERIHKESAQMDKNGNLPFSFSKPYTGSKARPATVQCDNCGAFHSGNVNTVGIVCRTCNTYSSVSPVED